MNPGYKQTDVGVIPEQWDVVRLSEIADFTSGALINVSALRPQSSDYPVPVFGGNGVAGYTNESLIAAPTVVIGRVGQKCGAIYLSKGPAWITDNALYPRRVGPATDLGFLALALERAGLNDVRNRNDLPLVTQAILRGVRIAWPRDVLEQRAVTAVLGDVDALIDALDRLIAKKHDLKEAATHQLLTGQTRLPGFAGEWRVKRLRTLGTTYGGLMSKTKSDFGQGAGRYIPFLNVINNVVIDPYHLEVVTIHPGESQNVVQCGDLFFNGSSETPEEVGMCSALLADIRDVYLNSFCFGFRLHSQADAKSLYLAYFFRSTEGRRLLYSLAQGATRYNISKTALLGREFALPAVDEQAAIATVLSDMDIEIGALQQRLAKTRALKQGMMQQLLTGRTRLV